MGDKEECDLLNRDPQGINNHIQVQFEDVLAEPDGAHSIDCVWRNSYKCFECGKNCCYKFMTTLCGICIALYWGCLFACIAFEHVWCITPCMRAYAIDFGAYGKFYRSMLNCCVAPLCEMCGLCHGKFTITKQ